MKNKILSISVATVGALALLFSPGSAQATGVTVDQIIYQNGSGVDSSLMSGTVDVVPAGNTLTITLRNTSPDSAFTDSSFPSLMLLTGVGLQLPGVDIVSGSVAVNGTALNFEVGQSLTDIGNQWNYGNAPYAGYNLPGVLTIDTAMSSVENGQATRFAGPPPNTIDGPDYGALSALETQFGASQSAVRDSIIITLNLSGAAPSVMTIDGGNVVLAFGSPDSVVPDGGSTLALLGLSVVGLGWLVRRQRKTA